ncbi:AtpZ/AtpI family protein [Vampirovibrio sp.]|uniref:AtpZ/AtpI family protein n=1 Tax=Vampirovibrio sp. TaxID=2717857 RepID=UPI0035930574
MEYAIQLLLPIIGGLWLGGWLSKTYGLSPIWTVMLGVLGLVGGIGIMYKRSQRELNLPRYTPKPKSQPKPSQSLQDLDSLYKKLHETPLDEQDDELDGLDRDETDPNIPPKQP